MQDSVVDKVLPEDTPGGDQDGENLANNDFINLDIDIVPFLPEPVLPVWSFLQDYPLVLILVMFSIGYAVGKGLQWLLRSSFHQATKRTKTQFDDKLITYLTAPVVQTTVILALIATGNLFDLSEDLNRFISRTWLTLLIILWGRAWFKATTLAISAMSDTVGRFELFQPRTRPLFEMGIKLFLVTVLVWMFMAIWNIDGTAWLASAGVIGIAVGFAARDTLANLISGVSIIADAPYKLGDFIILDTGERGVVTEVGMRSTRLLTRDDVEISIPNAVMGNAKITNESGGPAVEHRIRVPVSVAYGTRPPKVVEVLEDIARANEMILEFPAPRVRMRAFGQSSLDFELLGWIRLPELRGLARHTLLLEIEERFREEGITIPFPQQDVHIHHKSLLEEEQEVSGQGD